jgi:hypothetical protein
MSNLHDQLRGRPKEAWRGECIEIRQAYIENDMCVLFPDVIRAVNEVKRLMKRSISSNKGRAILILCGSGGGKSHFIKLLKRIWPNEDADEATLIRIVGFSVPGSPSQERLTKALLSGMGESEWTAKKVGIERPLKFIEPVGVWAIAIDNVHDIPEHKGTVGTRLATNWIRDLIEDCKRLVILLGIDGAREVVRSNPQLRRREPGILRIPYFEIESEKKLARFKRFLNEVDNLLPLAEASELEKFVKKIYWATYGIVDYIFKLLCEAVGVAVAAGREHLIEADLADAFDLVFRDAGTGLNPFLPEGPARVLDGVDEPFESWDDNAGIQRQAKSATTGSKKRVAKE